jgi:hypothetical protein
MASLQGSERSQFGYKRAAKAIVALTEPVSDLVSAGALREIEFVGPASARIVQDLDFMLAAQALEAGCLFALDSDAHATGELRFTDYAIAHARLARVPAERVVNCWSDDRLSAWMAERQLPTPSPPARSAKAARGRRAAR